MSEKEGKRFEGGVKKGEVRNPYGRAGKPTPNYRKIKEGFLQGFINSDAMGHLMNMLNMKLPGIMKYKEKFTDEEDKELRLQILKNYKWAVEQLIKVIPKEIGVFGKVQHEHTIAGMVKQATISQKSDKVIDLVKKEREEKLLEEKEEELPYEMEEYLEEEDNG